MAGVVNFGGNSVHNTSDSSATVLIVGGGGSAIPGGITPPLGGNLVSVTLSFAGQQPKTYTYKAAQPVFFPAGAVVTLTGAFINASIDLVDSTGVPTPLTSP